VVADVVVDVDVDVDDGDRSDHGHDHGDVHGHDLLRQSRNLRAELGPRRTWLT
jgi:hypothetical protein